MPKEKSPGKATTRRYTDVEKERAVRLCRQLAEELGTDHGVVRRIADRLGCGVQLAGKWSRDADIDDGVAGPDAQRVRDLFAENKEMSQELRELRRANDILKKTSAFYAAELDPHSGDRRFIDAHRDDFGVEPICTAGEICHIFMPSLQPWLGHR
jgi:transposase